MASWEGWELEVVDLDGKRVDKVLAVKLPWETESPAGEQGSSDTAATTDNG